ncbi:succinylglutamate desuccinylase/aspartoacylase family protein [Alkalimarinus coralli]|uniref:succinylglutamate desuccinylase/aspartoacylase family protein n=1 Tax=Alkalimarinus coralli TaxID=2935863 RepID=UPI00202B2F1A|nr:succinylglutamate desuccinylase/aspartoacylase family protein [Alkalimarinus coralli]
MADILEIAGIEIKPGETKRIELPAVKLYTDTSMAIPVFVRRGRKPGPTLFVSAAIHGDELNGIEIISRLINSKQIKTIRGTLIAVPFVNGYGVLNQSRYLPDRRDLNRSFPGSKRGSLAGRMSHLFLNEIVAKCDYGIDLHTGAIHRSNLPQIRANLDDEKTLAMAKAFGLPVLINSNLRDGSLRESADSLGVRILLYEAGEALRFDELSIRAGYKGIINVMRHLALLPPRRSKSALVEPFVARQSGWIRATDSGFVSHKRQLGDHVAKGDLLATIKDPFGQVLDSVVSNAEGIIIGKQNIPLAQEGEAMYHIAYFKKPDDVAENLEIMHDNLVPQDTTGIAEYKEGNEQK